MLTVYRLPGATNQLVAEVLAVNSNTVVVNQSGTPVAMPWIEKASAVVQVRFLFAILPHFRTRLCSQAFYGGNELGNGLVSLLIKDLDSFVSRPS